MRTALWMARLVLCLGLGSMLHEATLAQTANTQPIDPRVWSQHYWQKLAARGLVEVAQPTTAPTLPPSSTSVTMPGVPIDSRDVPISPLTNITQTENSIFVHPNDLNTVLNSNNSTNWPVSSLFGTSGFVSEDGGVTWRGQVNGTGGDNSGDPAAVIDRSGRFFVGYIAPNDGQGVARSLDRGQTWTHVQVADPRTANLLDKNHLWVDNSPTSPFVGNLYSAWTMFGGPNDAEIEITRSTDGGLTWSAPLVISSNVNALSHNQGVHIQTGPNGEVYVMWAIYDAFPADENALGFALSRDGGATFEPARRIITNMRGIRSSGTGKGIRTAAFPVMAADVSNSPRRGTLYAVWTNRGTPGNNTGNDVDGYLIKTTDHGATWSNPVRINQDALNLEKKHFFHWITCDPANGNLSVIYYDDRNVSSATSETFVSNSTNGGATWIDMRVSDVAFLPAPIPGLASGYFGDYLGIAAVGGKVYPTWTDNRDGRAMTYVSPFFLEQDSIPPSAIADLRAGDPSSNGIVLQWTARGDNGDSGRAASYDIRYALTPLDSTSFHAATRVNNLLVPQLPGSAETFEVTGLNFNTTYFFAIKVLDEQGNASPISNIASATTLGAPRIAVFPDSLADTLLTGANHTQTLTLRNIGAGTLDFTATATSSSKWLSVTPSLGRVRAGASFDLQARFEATGLDAGSYNGEIVLASNDPNHTNTRVPVHLQVLGAPDIHLSTSFLDFDSVLVNDTLALALEISNPGTDVLQVNLSASLPFDVAPNAFTLAPRTNQIVTVTFLPTALGVFADSLIVTSNDPDEARLSLALKGVSLPPPEIAIAPTRLDENLLVGQTRQQTLTITNSGESDLNFELAFENAQIRLSGLQSDEPRAATPTLRAELLRLARAATAGLSLPTKPADDAEGLAPAVLAQFRAQVRPYAQMVARVRATAAMPSFAVAGFNSTSLLSLLLSLSHSVSDYAYTDVGDNFTLATLQDFDAVIVDERDFRLTLAEAQALRDYAATGKSVFIGMDDFDNLAADVQAVIYPLLGVSAAFDADFAFGAFNPAHPITQNLSTMEIFNSADNDYFTLAGAEWLFADPSGNYFGVAHQTGARTALFGESLFAVAVNNPNNLLLLSHTIDWIAMGATGWVTLDKTSGRLAPNTSENIGVTFSAQGFRGGDYTADLVVASNDPDEKRTIVPVHLIITNAPDIAVANDTLTFGEVFIGAQAALTLLVTNTGTEPLSIASAVAAPEVFSVTPASATLAPGAREIFTTTFAPVSESASSGTLTLTSNDPDENPTVITLFGNGVAPPSIAVAPDSLAFILNAGDSASANLTIANNGSSALQFTLRDTEGSGASAPYVFWSQEYQAGPDTIFRANLDGTDARPIYIGSLGAGYGSIAYHPGEGRIYSAEYSEGRIFSVKIDGTDPRILVTGARSPFDIVLDLNAGHMYWAESNATGAIKRANLDGSAIITIVQAPGGNESAPTDKYAHTSLLAKQNQAAVLLNSPWSLDLDLTNRKIYWSELGGRRIMRANLDGSNAEVVSANVGTPGGLKLDVNAGKIYFVERVFGAMARMNLDGSNQETLLQTNSGSVADFKIDLVAQQFYWTDFSSDRVLRANFDGSNVATVLTRSASSSDGPFALGLTVGGSNWLFATPTQGTVAPGASLPITVEAKSKGLLGGNYRGAILIHSNDPLTSEVEVPVTLHVIGAARVEGAPDTVNFKPTFVGQSDRATITVRNSGTADLLLSDFQTTLAAFAYADSAQISLKPGAAKVLPLFFTPSAAQTYSGALNFSTNDAQQPNMSIVLLGEGLLEPRIVVAPDSLSARLKSGASTVRTLAINNNGGSALSWSASVNFSSTALVAQQSPRFTSQPLSAATKFPLAAPPQFESEHVFTFPNTNATHSANSVMLEQPLDSTLAKLNRNFAQINSAISNRFDFIDGETGNSIVDGGNDMYDGGNFISTNLGSSIFYSNNRVISNPAFGASGKYFTRKYPGLFVLAADMANVSAFTIDGNLGADGTGNVDGAILETTLFGLTYQGFVKRVFNAGDPSVNHLIIIAKNPAATQALGTSTDSDFHVVRNLNNTTRLYYLLYAGASGGYIDNAATLHLFNTFLAALELLPPWLTLNPTSGVVLPGEAQTVAARFDATSLPSATYRAEIAVSSNAPSVPLLRVPASLLVYENDALLALPDSSFGFPRDTVNVPLRVDFNTPLTLAALQSALKLSNRNLSFISYTPGMIVTRGLRVFAPSADSVRITFATEGGEYLRQSGVLATLHFRVADNALPGQSTALTFAQASATDSAGNAASVGSKLGLFITRKAPEVSGNVTYAQAGRGPVAGISAVLSRSGAIVQQQLTDNAGNYLLAGILPRTNYRVEVQRQSGGLGAAITPTDALLAAHASMGNITLNGVQSLAADVDVDLQITFNDALAIFNRYLGITKQYPAADWRAFPASYAIDTTANAWKAAPTGIAYPTITSDQLRQDYFAVARGDVDLSWTSATSAPVLPATIASSAHAANTITFKIAEARPVPGTDKIVVPIVLHGAALERGLYAFGGEVQYANAQMQITAVHWGALLPQQAFRANYVLTHTSREHDSETAPNATELTGRLCFGAFATASAAIRQGGVLFEIEARLLESAQGGAKLAFRLHETSAAIGASTIALQSGARFEAAHVSVAQEDEVVLAAPATFALQRNYPNPFNPTTELRYQLPEPATVSLTIFNALGQKVRTLVEAEKQSSGYYRRTWDGKNERGEAVSAGVYFYHLEAQGVSVKFQRTQKMLLLK